MDLFGFRLAMYDAGANLRMIFLVLWILGNFCPYARLLVSKKFIRVLHAVGCRIHET